MLIAQITDLHLRPPGVLAYGVADTNRLTERAIRKLATLRPQPDVVVITGDMTDCGLPEEYALLRKLLALLPMPVFMVPGNHDRRGNLKRAFADWPTIVADPDFVQFVVDDFPLRLIGLDTAVEKSDDGALCARRLEFLSDALAAAPGKPTVIFMHHPPFDCGLSDEDRARVMDGSAELAAILKRNRQVLALWCGHHHRPIETMFAACRPASSPASRIRSASAATARSCWSRRCSSCTRFRNGALVSHTVYVEDYPGPFPFIFEPDYPGNP